MNDPNETNPGIEARGDASVGPSAMNSPDESGDAPAAAPMSPETRRAVVKIGIATLAIYLALLGAAYLVIRNRFIGEGATAGEDIEIATIGFAVAWGVFAFSAGATFMVRRVWRAREESAGKPFGS